MPYFLARSPIVVPRSCTGPQNITVAVPSATKSTHNFSVRLRDAGCLYRNVPNTAVGRMNATI